MRVGFVLRSAEIKPLVPKICARKHCNRSFRVHLAPPPQTQTPNARSSLQTNVRADGEVSFYFSIHRVFRFLPPTPTSGLHCPCISLCLYIQCLTVLGVLAHTKARESLPIQKEASVLLSLESLPIMLKHSIKCFECLGESLPIQKCFDGPWSLCLYKSTQVL